MAFPQRGTGLTISVNYDQNISNAALDNAKLLNNIIASDFCELDAVDASKDNIQAKFVVKDESITAGVYTTRSGSDTFSYKFDGTDSTTLDEFAGSVKDCILRLASGLVSATEHVERTIRLAGEFVTDALKALVEGDFQYIKAVDISASAKMHQSVGMGSNIRMATRRYHVEKTRPGHDQYEVSFRMSALDESQFRDQFSLSYSMRPGDTGVRNMHIQLSELNLGWDLVQLSSSYPDYERNILSLANRGKQLVESLEQVGAFSGKPGIDLDPII